MVGGGVLFIVWRHLSRLPNVYSLFSIIFCYANRATLLKGPGLVVDRIIPGLPLIVVSGAFLASLFLSIWKNETSTQILDVEHGDQSPWGAVASCLV
ncbi:hypothetical protein CORC01_10412 [Colletotrichum orchidophilum]|uniref:Uncharacterized protein n=1 Tax=Colletotrichum orchidophilum TaxID=1209926 RepID=A0A1G4AYZ0_9PEZI|nr:uncharacterized protein CORC01_10412 [Colletotrichum orchidophilum]OHE94252.1 hypothetical protein CORC01_10412 [Colletotrichum orchidophilum]